MSEFDTRTAEPLFDPAELQQLVDHPLFQALTPNYPVEQALSPTTLTADDIREVLEALKPGSPLTRIERTFQPERPKRDLNRGLRLAYYNRGESKWCYLLARGAQRMAVILGGYDTQSVIPTDSRMCLVNRGFGKNFVSFCDLRTYLCLPVRLRDNDSETPSSLVFQEWGGENKLSNPKDPRILLAARRARNYIQSRGYTINSLTEAELSHPRHYLLNQGVLHLPAVIDIPCEQILADHPSIL